MLDFDITKTYFPDDIIYYMDNFYFLPKTRVYNVAVISETGISPSDERSYWREYKFTSEQVLAFATKVYKDVADLPGHEPELKDLKEWLENK